MTDLLATIREAIRLPPRLCGWHCGEPAAPGGIYCSTRHRVAAWRERQREGDEAPALRARADRSLVTSAGAQPLRRRRDLSLRLRSPGFALRRPGPRNEVVAALYVRADGPYSAQANVDPWPVERDATRYEGPHPVIAHPPCAPWGRFRRIMRTVQRADLAVRAVQQVRQWGGVLEHPAESHLWVAMELPRPGEPSDRWGGRSMLIRQSWWGHRAPKLTWLYFVGCTPPPVPPPVPDPGGRVKLMTRRDRELTPPLLAEWLVSFARNAIDETA